MTDKPSKAGLWIICGSFGLALAFALVAAIQNARHGEDFFVEFALFFLRGLACPGIPGIGAAVGVGVHLSARMHKESYTPLVLMFSTLIVLWFGSLLLLWTVPELRDRQDEIKAQSAEEQPEEEEDWQDRL